MNSYRVIVEITAALKGMGGALGYHERSMIVRAPSKDEARAVAASMLGPGESARQYEISEMAKEPSDGE